MKNFKLRLAFVLSFHSIFLFYGQNFQWAKGFAGKGGCGVSSIAVDNWGNVYSSGSFSGLVDFDPGPGIDTLLNFGGGFPQIASGMFVSKLNPSGNHVWVKRFKGADSRKISFDSKGNIYVVGFYGSFTDFDPGPATYTLAAIYGGEFILKLDSSGNFLWVKGFPSSFFFDKCSISIDSPGNIYVCGSFMDTLDFDPGPGIHNMVSQGLYDAYILKLDSLGNFKWVKTINGPNNNIALSMVLDKTNNVFLSGYFEGSSDFDPGNGTYNLTSAGNEDIFVLKLDSGGAFAWAKRIGNSSNQRSYSIFVDSTGSIYTTGMFIGNVDFDPGPGVFNMMFSGADDTFILKLNATGNFVWARSWGATGSDHGKGIITDAMGNIYTTGYFNGLVDFDPGASTYTLSSVAGGVFISKLDSSGNFVWAKAMGGGVGYSIDRDRIGNLYVGGVFYYTQDFDPGPGVSYLSTLGQVGGFAFKICYAGLNVVASNTIICPGNSVSLTVKGFNSYTWSTGSIGSSSIVVTPLVSTTYSVTSPLSHNCVFSDKVKITVDPCLDLGDISNKGILSVYPNPSSGIFFFEIAEDAHIFICDLLGKNIYSENLEGGKHKILLKDGEKGVYLLYAETNTARQTFKLIVE